MRITSNDIRKNIDELIVRIERSCKISGRDSSNIKLVAVSKDVDAQRIRLAYDAGIRDFGENYVQEMMEKIDSLPDDINWHFIGHLQTNKIKYLIPRVRLIQTVYKKEHLQEIDRRSQRAGIVSELLIEVNIGSEDSKSGTDVKGVEELVKRSFDFKNIKVIGLMCIPPISTPEKTREFFKNLHLLRDHINNSIRMELLKELSMGMSSDFEIAIEEGATIVRIGTALFGRRGGSL